MNGLLLELERLLKAILDESLSRPAEEAAKSEGEGVSVFSQFSRQMEALSILRRRIEHRQPLSISETHDKETALSILRSLGLEVFRTFCCPETLES